MIELILSAGLFFVLFFLFVGVIFPFIMIIRCALNESLPKKQKIIWLISTIFLWSLGCALYGTFADKSKRWRIFSGITLILFVLSTGYVAVYGDKHKPLVGYDGAISKLRKTLSDKAETERDISFRIQYNALSAQLLLLDFKKTSLSTEDSHHADVSLLIKGFQMALQDGKIDNREYDILSQQTKIVISKYSETEPLNENQHR
jgi:hypothetical protein